jgi:hypothetical protein
MEKYLLELDYRLCVKKVNKRVNSPSVSSDEFEIENTLIQLANLPESPISMETLFLIEISKIEPNIYKIYGYFEEFKSLFPKDILLLADQAMTNKSLTPSFIVKVKGFLSTMTMLWEKYQNDTFFSIKVEKYYKQIDSIIKELESSN